MLSHAANGTLRSRNIYATQGHSHDCILRSGTNYFFAKDHLGSIKAVINIDSGTAEQIIHYDEFGRVLSDSNPGFQPFGFAGGHYDHQTGLVRFGARDYDAEIGRWLSKDPILFAGGDTNLYGYVLNDPVNLIDPEGTVPLAVWPVWTGVVGGVVGIGSGVYNSSSCSAAGVAIDAVLGGVIGFAGGFLAGVGGAQTVIGKIGAVVGGTIAGGGAALVGLNIPSGDAMLGRSCDKPCGDKK